MWLWSVSSRTSGGAKVGRAVLRVQSKCSKLELHDDNKRTQRRSPGATKSLPRSIYLLRLTAFLHPPSTTFSKLHRLLPALSAARSLVANSLLRALLHCAIAAAHLRLTTQNHHRKFRHRCTSLLIPASCYNLPSTLPLPSSPPDSTLSDHHIAQIAPF